MHIQGVEEDVDDEEMLRQAIALSLQDVQQLLELTTICQMETKCRQMISSDLE